jgi:hypothetical protein
MANRPVTTLLIGLGGSGAWTAVHVKRQLYDSYDNQLPENVAIAVLDTAKTVIVGVGPESPIRQSGMGIGRTELDRAEIAHVGGDTFDLVKDIDETDQYPHIKSWFLTSTFLSSLPRATFELDQGAGQFRQFGRLALFRDVMAPNTSAVAAIIESKLKNLQQKQKIDDPAIAVIITGSLAGGTGAGMFIDVAHLAQRVAELNNIKITLRGFFFLPQAFTGTLKPGELDPARARGFAALRELQRFILNSDYQYGYPMYYHGERHGMNRDLWRAKHQGKLYDYVYLIDGDGGTNMNRRKLEHGSAPAVADAIVNFIDEHFGRAQNQYENNTRGKIQDRQSETGIRAYISTLGAYSILMPIPQIIEGWAYRLSRETLLKLIPASGYSDRGYMTEISRKDNPEQGVRTAKDEVKRLSKEFPPMLDPIDPKGQRMLLPLPLWAKSFEIYDSPENEPALLKRLGNYNLVDWLEMLVPPQSQTDPDTQAVLNSAAKVLNQKVDERVVTSDEREGGDPTSDHRTIQSQAERFINSQLGMPTDGGGRQGGEYREALDGLTQLQARRYREYMTAYLFRELNGEGRQDIMKAKSGKLGWLTAVLEEFGKMAATVRQLLNTLSGGGEQLDAQRGYIEETLSSSLRLMNEKKDARNLIGMRKEAIDAQKSYRTAVSDYISYYRMEFARDEVARALDRIVSFTEVMLAELAVWKRVLATDVNSLHNELVDGTATVQSDRRRSSDIANHRVIDDREWEDEKYNQYVTETVRQNMMRAWRWKVELYEDRGQTRFGLNAVLAVDPTQPDSSEQVFRKDVERQSSKWSQDNLTLIMEFTRRFFRSAMQQESLLTYLMDHYDPSQLASELADNSKFMLSFNINQNTGSYIPGNILLANYDDRQPQQMGYMRDVLARLVANKNQGDISSGKLENTAHITEQCANPFRLTLISTAELIPMEGISAYDNCEQKYWDVPYDTRQKNHIFGAEVRAVEYEEKLRQLKQQRRVLSDRVALLLEDEDRFMEFLFLITHQLINQQEIQDNKIVYYWTLLTPHPDARRRGELEEWKLTKPSDSPSLLDAAIRYVIIGTDVDNASHDIRRYDDFINQVLRAKQDGDTKDRIERDVLALNDRELREWYNAFLPPINEQGEEDLSNWTEADDTQFLEAARLIVLHDMMQELVNDFKQYVEKLGVEAAKARQSAADGESHNAALRKRELYDLFSVAIIALEKEIFKYRALVSDRYKQKTTGKRGRSLLR